MPVSAQRVCTRRASAALPRERDPVPVIQVAAWNPGQSGRVQKILPSTDFDPQTV